MTELASVLLLKMMRFLIYVVLATGRPGETGVEERFSQAQKQAQSFPVGSAGIDFIDLPMWPRHLSRRGRMRFSLLGSEEGRALRSVLVTAPA